MIPKQSSTSNFNNPVKDELKRVGSCYYCKEMGHMRRDCPKGPCNQKKESPITEAQGKAIDFLEEINENISISQLLKASPEIFTELNRLLKKTEIKKEVGLVENDTTTNFKAIVSIFKKNYATIIDTEAACSVATTSWILETESVPDEESSQKIVTADEKKHKTLGIVSRVTIFIAGYHFDVNLLVMENARKTIILDMDWLKDYETTIEIKNQELILPLEDYDAVLSLSASAVKDTAKKLDEEFLGIDKESYSVEAIDEVD
ncbi:hypothetical protein AYI68_g5923 [Smittium mucronatum]|uniref:CCHC-type domain-containing protein n=1 Tax=Smittium mucronatum TaxID=133383 RepID=A0A1R0GSX2_9FUNG|nr:hypothetical protein AYI68_g5923 [Smittium mucronatum]